MGQCMGSAKANKYIIQQSPQKHHKELHYDPLEASTEQLPPPPPSQLPQKDTQCPPPQLNFQSTVEIKRKPSEASGRNATVKSGLRSSRTCEGEAIDERVARLMEREPLMAAVYLQVRRNLGKL